MKYYSIVGKFKNRIISTLKKDRKILALSFIIGLAITLTSALFATKRYSDTIQAGISDSVVRFHVLANSDDAQDQALKVQVKDNVLEILKERLNASESLDETKEILSSSLLEIKEEALRTIEEAGYSYDVDVSISRDLFPIKQYGDVVLPSGMYDTLRIDIGGAQGQNWWCVMYPPLCFVDVTCEEIPEENKQELRNILTEEEYSVVVRNKTNDTIVPEVKLKIVEWWQEK